MSDNNEFTHEFQIYTSDLNAGTMGTGKFLLFDNNINAVKVQGIDNIKIGGGANGRVLATDGEGNLRWISAAAVTGGISSYDELDNLPDLSVYATESWVNNQGFITSVDTGNFTFTNNTITTDDGQSIVLSIQGYDNTYTPPWFNNQSWTFGFDGYLTTVGLALEHAQITAEEGENIFDANVGKNLRIRTHLTPSAAPWVNDWIFDTDGTLRVPGTITMNERLTLNSLGAESGYTAAVLADGNLGRVFVRTLGGTDATLQTWEFNKEGQLMLPNGGDIVDSAGNSVLGGGSRPTNEITNTDPEGPTYSVSVGTDGVVTMVTSRGNLEFGALPEPGGPTHFHIMRPAGQEGSSDLYFGDDYNYVKMPSSSYSQQGVEIGSSLNQGTVSVWRFGTDGDLVLPAGKTIRDTTGTDLLADDTGGDPAYKGFKASYGRMWGNNDDPNGPINKIVIYKDTVTPSSTIDASTNDDTFTVTGLSGSDIVAMLVVIGDEVNQTTTAELKTFAESIIDNVILDGGIEGNLNSINGMRTAFYNNFATFSATLTDLKTNFEFFSVNNQFNISPQFETGKGATFNGISYNMSDNTLDLGSWGQNAGTHQVGDVFVIPGNTIQDANGNFLLTPDNDVTLTVTVAPDGYIGTAVLTGTLPRPQEVWPNNSIGDGGDDEYDTGNYITTNLESNISYNSGAPIFNSTAFGGGDYVVTYQNSIFGVFAVNPAIDSIATQGGSGFDGNGQADTGSLYGAANSGVNIGDFVFNGSTMTAPDDDLYIKAVDDLWLDALQDDIHIRANDDVRIKVGYDFQNDTAQREWRFDTDGYINFPDGSQQSTAYTGNSFSGNYYDLTNKPTGTTAVHDLIGGASSADDGKYLKQTSIGVSEWADLPTNSYTPADATNWSTPAPTTISEALDRLAAKIAYLSNQGYTQKP